MNKHFDDLEEKRAKESEQANIDKASHKFTSKDSERALRKLGDKAADYNPSSAAALKLDSFNGSSMEKHVFHSLCNTVFQLNFSPTELGALLAAITINENGTVDGKKFLVFFHRLGAKVKETR